jgi:hypothetical protein
MRANLRRGDTLVLCLCLAALGTGCDRTRPPDIAADRAYSRR